MVLKLVLVLSLTRSSLAVHTVSGGERGHVLWYRGEGQWNIQNLYYAIFVYKKTNDTCSGFYLVLVVATT